MSTPLSASPSATLSPEALVPAASTKRRPPTPPAARRSFDTSRPIVKPQLQRPPDARVSGTSQAASPVPVRPKHAVNHSPPRVNITSPKSPHKAVEASEDPNSGVPWHTALEDESRGRSRPLVPPARNSKVPGRTAAPVSGPLNVAGSTRSLLDGGAQHGGGPTNGIRSGESPRPPPFINRAAKPEIPTQQLTEATARTDRGVKPNDTKRISPFSTPPDSDEDLTSLSSPPEVPVTSKPKEAAPRTPHNALGDSLSRNTRSSIEQHPPRLSSSVRGRPNLDRHRSKTNIEDLTDTREARPMLPPRRDESQRDHDREPDRSPIGSTRSSLESPPRHSALAQGFSRDTPARKISYAPANVYEDQLPGLSRSLPKRDYATRSVSALSRSPTTMDVRPTNDADPIAKATPLNSALVSEFPNTSRLNRRPPCFADGPRSIQTGYDCRVFALSGDYVCTSGFQTRVWSLSSGKILLSMAHGEQVKVTAISFKPARKIEDDGLKLWLGTNWGEIQELEISSKRITAMNEHVHARREVIEIHRRAAELWTVDQEGKLVVWPPDADGTPNLDNGVLNGRVPRGMTTSIVVGEELWLATGKSVWIYRPSATPDKNAFQATQASFTLGNAGDMISSALIPSQQDRVYFGHADGKISSFSRIGGQHIETVNVNLYKINCLVGVQDHLWAGYNTGMIHVYDTKTRPWTTTKSWLSHANPVVGLKTDRDSLWKQNRMHVISLGVDTIIGIWDGLTEDDWLGKRSLFPCVMFANEHVLTKCQTSSCGATRANIVHTGTFPSSC